MATGIPNDGQRVRQCVAAVSDVEAQLTTVNRDVAVSVDRVAQESIDWLRLLPDDLLLIILDDLKKDPQDIKNLMVVCKRVKCIVEKNPELKRIIEAHNDLMRVAAKRDFVPDPAGEMFWFEQRRGRLVPRYERPNYPAMRTALLAKIQEPGCRKLGIAVEVGAISMDDLIFLDPNNNERMRYLSLGLNTYLDSLPNPRLPNENRLEFYRRQFQYVREHPRDMDNLRDYIRSGYKEDSPIGNMPMGSVFRDYFPRFYPELFFRSTQGVGQ